MSGEAQPPLPTLYRLVKSEEVQLDDFDSWMVRGVREPYEVEKEHPEQWAGLSMFDTEQAARKMAKGLKKLPRYVAKIENLDRDWIVVGPPDLDHHYDVWGSPKHFLAAVTGIRRFDAPLEG